jgi:anti-sigma B factor antagonist
MTEFKINSREISNINVLDLSGFLDAHTAPVLEEAFTNLISQGKYKIVVNFSSLDYISSAGLGVFMAFIDKVRSNSGDIKMTSMPNKIFNIFDLLGFPLLYEIYSSESDAVNKYNEK